MKVKKLLSICLSITLFASFFAISSRQLTASAYSTDKSWEFNTDGNKEGWTAANGITSDSVSGGYYNGTITGTDPYIVSGLVAIDITNTSIINIKMKNSTTSTSANIFFITNTDKSWNSAKHKSFTITANDPEYTEYAIDMSTVSGWTGTLYQLRVDPEEGATGSFSIDYIRIGAETRTGTIYYVSVTDGNDSNNGTSSITPWKTLGKASAITYLPGDKLLLKCGDSWTEQLTLTNCTGTSASGITIGSYGTGSQPQINRTLLNSEVCIQILNGSYITVDNLNVGNSGMGIQFYNNSGTNRYSITVQNCYFHDIYGISQAALSSAFPGAQFSSAILLGANITGVNITNCSTYNCGSLMGSQNDVSGTKYNVNVSDCTMNNNTEYGIVISETSGGTMSNCTILHNGTANMIYGSTSIMLGNLTNYTVTNNEIGYQQRYGTNPDGCGIDFEVNCTNVTVSNNYIHHCAGVGVYFYTHTDVPNSTYNTVSGNTFKYNNQNPNTSSAYGSEVNLYSTTANNYGSIINNYYYEQMYTTFINSCDSSVTVSNNTVVPVTFTATKSWEFNTDGNKEGWTAANQITGDTVSGGYYSGNVTGTDPYTRSSANLGTNITNNKYIKIKLKNSTTSTSLSVYFLTTTSLSWNEAKSRKITINANDADYTEYTVDLSCIAGWTGTLYQLRLDPENGASIGTFSIDYIRIGTQG